MKNKSIQASVFNSNYFPASHQSESDPQRTQDSIQVWAWLNQGHFSEKTKEAYARIVRDFFTTYPNLGLKTTLSSIVTLYLRSKTELSASSRNLYRNALSSLFQYLENTDYIKKNPVKVTRKEKVLDEFYFKILSLSQINRMLQKANSPRDRLVIETLYYTGLRVSELAQIKVSDLSAASLNSASKKKNKKSKKRTTMPLPKYLVVKGKGGKMRTILTGDVLAKKIKNFIVKTKLQPKHYLFSQSEKPISRIRIYMIIKRLCEKSQIETPGGKLPSPHWFRHTSAIHALDNGADIQVVQSTLGHASLATTGRYLKSRPLKSNANYLKKIQTT